ncbi:hypothetical protein WME99_17680 [Sorangium sp. So ce136]|uniref:hypothetical protein n=1 Tax=Sorangium sp. So ce136 TaxID=3133284 RepID=UPI003EFD7458
MRELLPPPSAVWFALIMSVAPGACGPPRPQAHAQTEAAQVLTWTVGRLHRDPMPATGDGLLLLVPAGAPPESGARVARACAGATSFLPAPGHRRRFFVACRGRIFVAQGEALSPLPGQDPDLYVWNLLAFRTAQSPLQMLVSATPAGAAETQIWQLQIEEMSMVGATPVDGAAELASMEVFFASFHVPRCLGAARRCLVLNQPSGDEPQALDAWDGRPDAATPIQELGTLLVQDVAWASRDGRWLYMLAGQR